MRYKNTNEFSPITPKRAGGIRLGAKASNAHQNAEINSFPDINSPNNA
jgi:hypothetical protein